MTAVAKQPESYIDVIQQSRGGFNFDNAVRNKMMADKMGMKMTATKSGTTICGCIVDGAVILAADTRATNGPMVADKNCDKLHKMADYIYCAGAGTAADLEHTTELMASQLTLHKLATGMQTRVCTVVRRLSQLLYRYQGHIGCALVLGGVDITGPHLYQIYPHGSTDKLPFTAMGSGSLAAMSVLESKYKDGLTIEEGKQLVADAIRAGIFNDLGSGGNVDVVVLKRNAVEYFRGFDKPNERKFRAQYKSFQKGTTPITGEEFKKYVQVTDGDGDVVMG